MHLGRNMLQNVFFLVIYGDVFSLLNNMDNKNKRWYSIIIIVNVLF